MAIKEFFLECNNCSIEFAVFICGAVVMIFELIGSRLIGPYVGTSIYAWTSLIGVILASLSLGYYFGGRFADKNSSRAILGTIIAISATMICFTVILKDVGFLLVRMPLPIEIKSIIISIILFAPASFFLGMVSPYAVRLRINKLETVGRETGNLYALSTFGSIFGTFLAGFFIIPHFGSIISLFIIAFALLIVSIFLIGKQIFKGLWIIIILLVPITLTIFYYLFNFGYYNFIIADIDTQYNRVWIYKGTDPETKKPTINFSTDPFGTQAAVFSDGTDDLVFDYTKFFRLAGYLSPNIKNALMIGGCVYTYPRDFVKNFPEAHMDIVEIDPTMTEIAKKYFYFKESSNITIFNQDGRIFLNENKKKYDVIFGDAFNSASSIPFQLTTREMVKKEFDSLNDDGVVLLNVISSISGEKGKFLRAEYATYKEIFPIVLVFLASDPSSPGESQNVIIVALKSEKAFDREIIGEEFREYLSHLWAGPIITDMPVLTDDFAPVEYYKRKSI